MRRGGSGPVCAFPWCSRRAQVPYKGGPFCGECWKKLDDDEQCAFRLAVEAPMWSSAQQYRPGRPVHGWSAADEFEIDGVAAERRDWGPVFDNRAAWGYLAEAERAAAFAHACRSICRKKYGHDATSYIFAAPAMLANPKPRGAMTP